MTALEKRCKAAIIKWCKKNKTALIRSPRHIHPRAYVIGYAGPGCIVVASPWVDAEPMCKKFEKDNTLEIIRKFDKSITAGSWVTTSYVITKSAGEPIAIPVVE